MGCFPRTSRAIQQEVEPTIHDRYDFGIKLGEGAFAKVFLATEKRQKKRLSFKTRNPQTFAIKVCDKMKLGRDDLIALQQEISLLQSLKGHDHIVKLYDVYMDPKSCYLVMEYMAGGQLLQSLVTLKKYTEKDAMHASAQILKALDYCHSRKIAHRDIKLDNILLADRVENNGSDVLLKSWIKLGDFGFAINPAEPLSRLMSQCGTPLYVAPEILKGKPYGYMCDMWSFGVVVYILLCGYAPFQSKDTKQLYRSICNGNVVFDEKYWAQISQEAKNFITSLLTLDPSRRLSASEAAKHAWFRSVLPQDLRVPSEKMFDAFVQDRLRVFHVKEKLRAAIYTVIAVNKLSSLGIQFHTMMADLV